MIIGGDNRINTRMQCTVGFNDKIISMFIYSDWNCALRKYHKEIILTIPLLIMSGKSYMTQSLTNQFYLTYLFVISLFPRLYVSTRAVFYMNLTDCCSNSPAFLLTKSPRSLKYVKAPSISALHNLLR